MVKKKNGVINSCYHEVPEKKAYVLLGVTIVLSICYVIMMPANRKSGGIRKHQQAPQEGSCSDKRHLFISSSSLNPH